MLKIFVLFINTFLIVSAIKCTDLEENKRCNKIRYSSTSAINNNKLDECCNANGCIGMSTYGYKEYLNNCHVNTNNEVNMDNCIKNKGLRLAQMGAGSILDKDIQWLKYDNCKGPLNY